MSSPEVGQSQYLAGLFQELLRAHSPGQLAVVGCATGNGFEAISRDTDRVVGIDINPDYLELLWQRYGSMLPGLELICADVAAADATLQALSGALELVHCALVFECVDPAHVLTRIAAWLRTGGRLSVVAQAIGEFVQRESS